MWGNHEGVFGRGLVMGSLDMAGGREGREGDHQQGGQQSPGDLGERCCKMIGG